MSATLPTEVKLENKPCPLGCEVNDEVVIVSGDRLHGLPGEFTIVKCKTCGLMRTNVRPTPETMAYYYPDDYQPFQKKLSSSLVSQKRPLWKRLLAKIGESYGQVVPPLAPGNMLEVGCAGGLFLHAMAQRGWTVEGIEPDRQSAQAAQEMGYKVHVGQIETAPDTVDTYDLVTGWMVLEHLHEPVLALRRLHSWTSPGGWMACSVPNAASWEFRVFKDQWFALQLPTHLYHYTPQTIRTVLEAGGWRVERIFYQRNFTNVIVSLGYWLQQRFPDRQLGNTLVNYQATPLAFKLLVHPLGMLSGILGLTGRMTIWAQRIDDVDFKQ